MVKSLDLMPLSYAVAGRRSMVDASKTDQLDRSAYFLINPTGVIAQRPDSA